MSDSHPPPGSMLSKMNVWLWAGPDERRLWTASCGGRSASVALAAWRWVLGLYFLAFQIWYWSYQSDPGFYLAYLTEETMWLTLSYFLISATTGTLALMASYAGTQYAPGIPALFSGRKLTEVPWVNELLWKSTLRAQLILFGIT